MLLRLKSYFNHPATSPFSRTRRMLFALVIIGLTLIVSWTSITAVIVSRFLLNLQAANQQAFHDWDTSSTGMPQNAMSSRSSGHSTLVFERTIGSIASPLSFEGERWKSSSEPNGTAHEEFAGADEPHPDPSSSNSTSITARELPEAQLPRPYERAGPSLWDALTVPALGDRPDSYVSEDRRVSWGFAI